MKPIQMFPMFYFAITYITTILLTKPSPQVQEVRFIVWIIPFLVWIISFIITIYNKRIMNLWISGTKSANLYFLSLGLVMVVTNVVSVNIFYSLFSGLFSVMLIWLMFNVIGPLLIISNKKLKYKKFITIQLICILIFSVIGNLIIPSWDWDSTVRFSGGVNPNMMALICLFCFVWFLDIKIDKLYSSYSTLGIALSTAVLFWTLSRGRIVSFVFLILYLFITFHFILAISKLEYETKKRKLIVSTTLGIVLIIFMVLGIFFISNNSSIMSRILTPISGRLNAWRVLVKGFKNNIFFGSFGWWNANDIIRQYAKTKDMATSAHNFYLRVLSEIGIIGLFAILVFPAGLVIKSLKKALFGKNINHAKRKKLLIYSGAILAFFLSQIVEDQYLHGIGDFQTGLFAWILTLNYYYLIEDKLKVIKVEFTDKIAQ